MENNKLELSLNLNNLTEEERNQLMKLIEKSTIEQNNGESLIGRKITKGTRFKVINIKPHKKDSFNYKCVDEYLGKIGRFNSTFTFVEDAFMSTATFDEEYINAIDKKNGVFCWRHDEIELLND